MYEGGNDEDAGQLPLRRIDLSAELAPDGHESARRCNGSICARKGKVAVTTPTAGIHHGKNR